MTWPQDERRAGSRCNSEQCMERTVGEEHCRVCQQQLEQQAYHEEERQYQQLLEQQYHSSLSRQQRQYQHQHQQELLRRHHQQHQQHQQHQMMMMMAMNGDRSGDHCENFDDENNDNDNDNDGTCGDRYCTFCSGREHGQRNYSTSCQLDGDEDDRGGPGASLGGVSSSVCTASTGTMSWYTQNRGYYQEGQVLSEGEEQEEEVVREGGLGRGEGEYDDNDVEMARRLLCAALGS